jgi:hypothetical protein
MCKYCRACWTERASWRKFTARIYFRGLWFSNELQQPGWCISCQCSQMPRVPSDTPYEKEVHVIIFPRFASLPYWDQHFYRAHHKTHTKPFKCNETGCNASFALKKDCTRHFQDRHGSVRWFCDFPGCTYMLARDGASRKANVERHVRVKHKAQNPSFYCRSK